MCKQHNQDCNRIFEETRLLNCNYGDNYLALIQLLVSQFLHSHPWINYPVYKWLLKAIIIIKLTHKIKSIVIA